ncbi:MAG: hypothetical protein HY787_01740 [Deltaproteobacteria bacterium]|nr:hypothetical protein [Deltaproteobacteria bacterium]
MEDRSCKRCSVTRVNNLCKVYEKAHQNNHPGALNELRKVVHLVKARGYQDGIRLLNPGLAGQDLRAFCWNVSSFLEDEELKQILSRIPNK